METRPLNEYPANELEALQLSLSIAYQANSVLHGKDSDSNLSIMRWADRIREAIKEQNAIKQWQNN